ncbi:MAG: nuclear transport factor 2 family protein [Candidatus Aminicenantes bacterium]|nr:MAG: nuclear transport factor 2 family protein [Candidatus Aminicenantes bacterium]
MKAIFCNCFIALFLFFASVSSANSHNGAPSRINPGQDENTGAFEEEVLIKSAVEDLYIKGLESRNFDMITEICIPQTLLMSADKEGKLHVTTLERWSKRFDPENPPFKHLDSCIVKIDREGSAAQVKISFLVDSEQLVTDFLHMLKIEGKWRIVNIIDY